MPPLIAPPETPPNLLRFDLAFFLSARIRSTSPSSSASSLDLLRTLIPWSLPFWSIKWNWRSILSKERWERASSMTRSEPFLIRNSSNWSALRPNQRAFVYGQCTSVTTLYICLHSSAAFSVKRLYIIGIISLSSWLRIFISQPCRNILTNILTMIG